MILAIAGVIHQDPLGPSNLYCWYRDRLKQFGVAPVLIATEWGQRDFECFRSSRPVLRKLAREKWPTMPSETLIALELAFGYEPEVHLKLLPTASVLWLGRDRQQDDDELLHCAELRLTCYAGYLSRSSVGPSDPSVLSILHKEAWQSTPLALRGGQRDLNLAEAFMNQVTGLSGTWSAVVLGASHASDRELTTRQVLEHHGYTCDATFMGPAVFSAT